ncbi:hypothetical protein, partial [Micrococcus luteus]|uniref:hypothetical protein n=1 Tax=Micrococcus luteus TaxID=1270 RepID=UPI00055FDD5B
LRRRGFVGLGPNDDGAAGVPVERAPAPDGDPTMDDVVRPCTPADETSWLRCRVLTFPMPTEPPRDRRSAAPTSA